MAGMQNFLKAFDFAHRLDEDAAADSDEDQGFARPRIYKQRSRGLCKYMRLCKHLGIHIGHAFQNRYWVRGAM